MSEVLIIAAIGAFLCGVAVLHTVMLRTYKKRREEEPEQQ